MFNPNKNKVMVLITSPVQSKAERPLQRGIHGATKQLLRIMKLTAIILLTACLTASATGHSQITISEKNVPLEKVFTEIRKQTGFYFFYEVELLKAAKPVTIDVKNASLQETLAECFKDQPLTYTIVNQTVVVKQLTAKSLNEQTTSEPPPPIDVHGKIVNEKGEPVAGVSVQAKGTRIGTNTDANGEFTLKGIDEKSILLFSAVNIETFEIKVNGKTELSILNAKTKVSPLDEVHVIAYGTTTQRYSVGSQTKVTAEEIAKQPVSNPLATLEGRVPGLVVTQTSGVPGGSFRIQIRGQNSLNPNPNNSVNPMDNPFFIIDGVPFAPQNANVNQFTSLASPGASLYANPYGGISPFNSINPDDIESIEVLRDADATSIYGSRGANGVIIITTKSGKAGKAKFDARVWTGESQVTRTMPLMNTQQYLQMRHEAFKNDNITPTVANAKDLLIYDTTSFTDWKKYFLGGTAHVVDASANLSGGTNNTQFLIGAGYHHETYIFPGNFSDSKASINTKWNHNSTDHRLSLNFSANYSYDKNNSSGAPNPLVAFTLPPDYPALLDANGNLNWTYKGVDPGNNPIAFLRRPYSAQTYNLLSNFQIGYQILKGITIRSNFGYNTFNEREYQASPGTTFDPNIYGANFQTRSSANFGTNDFRTWIIEPQAEYVKVISKGRLDALVGATFQQNTNIFTSINATNYSNDALLGSISAAGSKTAGDGFSIYKYSAIFSRVNYTLNNRYILNVTGRRDGSTRFGPGKQFGNFGSIGGGWIFSEESFSKKIPVLSYGKLKATYGTVGNDNIGNYQYLSAWSPNSTLPFQGSVGYIPQNLFNTDFSWSITKKLEIGLETGFLNNHILTNITWFQSRCGNQLVSYRLPTQTGFTNVTENFPALVQNTGWEIQINSTNIKTKQFSWSTSLNLTIPKNKLISFPGIESSSYYSLYIVGKSLSVLQKYKYIGVNDTTGIYQYVDIHGSRTYTPTGPTDFQVIGNQDPQFYGGLRNTINFKGIQLEFLFQFNKQKLAPNYLSQIYSYGPVGGSTNQPSELLSRWQKPGDNVNTEMFTTQAPGTLAGNSSANYFILSSGAYSDASFVRLKTLSISYSFADKDLKKIKATGCNVYLNVQNLFTITSYKGNDPENQNFFALPPLKTIVAGLQFTF